MDDVTLIAAVGAGDHAALRNLYEQHAPWVAGRLRRVLPAHAVEDVLQETFIAVWRGAGKYRGSGDVGGWIWGIARRQAALWARRNSRPALVWDEHPSDDPATIAATRADLDRAFESLGDADDQQRRLARLVFVEDRPMAEVARILDVPTGTVKSRVHKVRRLLQQALGREQQR